MPIADTITVLLIRMNEVLSENQGTMCHGNLHVNYYEAQRDDGTNLGM